MKPIAHSVSRLTVALALALAVGSAPAQTFPAKPIRIIVPYAPAGLLDTTLRNIAQEMSGPLGQTVVVENRPGGSTFIGMSACAKSPPDGYTLCMGPIVALAIWYHRRECKKQL